MLVMILLPIKTFALELTPPEVPISGQEYMPQNTESLADGLWEIIQTALGQISPSLTEAAGTCLAILATVLLLSLAQSFTGLSEKTTHMVGTAAIAGILFGATRSMVHLGMETIAQISDYGKLLLPVLTCALAAQGGTTSSAALYTGTAVFDTVLASLMTGMLGPLIYIYLCLSVANCATGEDILGKLRDFAKWLATWTLKIGLYVFTGYMGITRVITGTTDAAALKATKLTISGMVPVVGGILSDASETVLVSAGLMKNAVGIYGLLAIAAIWIEPFLRIGIHYLLLKCTAALCSIYGSKQVVTLLQSFTSAMGILLAMTGTLCLMLLVSVICFMKGVS